MADDDAPAMSYASCSPRLALADLRKCAGGSSLPDDPDDEQTAIIEAAIAEVLYLFDNATAWTFRGPCTSTIQPLGSDLPCGACTPGRDEILSQVWPSYLPPMLPYVANRTGELGGPTLVNCWYTAACPDAMTSLRLPWLPVRQVVEVKIGVDVLDVTKWRQVPGTNLLLRTDGEPFPSTQNLGAEPGTAGTWTVKFVHGWDMPPGASRRAAAFASMISRYCLDENSCKLPENVRIVRRGDSEFMVVDNYREKGLTGYQPLDDWIMNWRHANNNDGASTRPRMTRPGRGRPGSVRATPWPV